MRQRFLDNNSKKNKATSVLKKILLFILIISFFILVYCIYVSITIDESFLGYEEYNTERLSAKIDNVLPVQEEKTSIVDVIEDVNQSVVGVSKLKNKGMTIFSEDGDEKLGIGSGFVISEDGYIVTNEHVAGDIYTNCYVTLQNGVMYTGQVVWSDSDVDLSLIKINAEGLKYIEMGNADDLKITQRVYAIGNPIGFEFQKTVTSGIISGINRTIKITDDDENKYMSDLIQTDASINPGNSGGPLIDENGKAIGINSIKIASADGIGFAIPINLIKPVLDGFKTDPSYQSATLGIFAYDKDVIPYIKQDLGINQLLYRGIFIAKVTHNSAADKAGIKEGNVLLKIDGVELEKMRDLRQYIYSKRPGDHVNVVYLNGKKEEEKEIILTKKTKKQ